jgi:hypothetical protein
MGWSHIGQFMVISFRHETRKSDAESLVGNRLIVARILRGMLIESQPSPNNHGATAMSSAELTRTQVKAIAEALFPGVNYLYRFKQRMVKAGFPEDDELYQLVCQAYEASWALRLEVLSMAAHGAGRPPRPE